MIISVDEMKQYLRVDSSDEDTLIEQLIQSAETICRDVARLDEETFNANSLTTRVAVLYAVAYLYEHREEADHHELILAIRSLLFGVREEKF